MLEKYILSIPLLSSDEESYAKKRDKRFQKQIDALRIKKGDNETLTLVESQLKLLNPYCYPYNAIIGFAEIWIDTMDVLVNYIHNGDGRKVYNQYTKAIYPNTRKHYDTIHHRAVGTFYSFDNKNIFKAMSEALEEVQQDCKDWKITFDKSHYDKLLCSIDYVTLLKD